MCWGLFVALGKGSYIFTQVPSSCCRHIKTLQDWMLVTLTPLWWWRRYHYILHTITDYGLVFPTMDFITTLHYHWLWAGLPHYHLQWTLSLLYTITGYGLVFPTIISIVGLHHYSTLSLAMGWSSPCNIIYTLLWYSYHCYTPPPRLVGGGA